MCKLASSSEFPIECDERFKVTSFSLFIPDFNLLSFELDSFNLKCYIGFFYINIILKQNKTIKMFFLKNLKLNIEFDIDFQ